MIRNHDVATMFMVRGKSLAPGNRQPVTGNRVSAGGLAGGRLFNCVNGPSTDVEMIEAPFTMRSLAAVAVFTAVGCAGTRPVHLGQQPVWPDASAVVSDAPATDASPAAANGYQPVPDHAAALLGCAEAAASSSSPICETAPPSDEEYAAFSAEANRLARHDLPLCRRLGDAVASTLPRVRMYRKALIRYMGAHRYYGVGHSYEIDDVWLVRVARRLDDLNDRTIAEMKRTLRHEVSHTIGASEEQGSGWTAENYARNCS